MSALLQADSSFSTTGMQQWNELLTRLKLYPEDYGAVGDGTTDDSTAFQNWFAAIAYTGRKGGLKAKRYRITSGYTTTANYWSANIEGDRVEEEGNAGNVGTIAEIYLDNASASSFFFKSSHRGLIKCNNLQFRCAQEVKDRKFFIFDSSINFEFAGLRFESVETPIYLDFNCYFQSSSLRDVQFRASGTIHSEGAGGAAGLKGTLLRLDNVNHEAGIPANTEKIVMDLRGVRIIESQNLLLEGALPATGWTVLRLSETFDAAWPRAPLSHFANFYNEWGGTQPLYVVDQERGRVSFTQSALGLYATSQYRLRDSAQCTIEESVFTASQVDYTALFSIEDFKCHVFLNRCSLRPGQTYGTNEPKFYDRNFTLTDCIDALDGASEMQASAAFSNTQSSLLYKWNGGYFDGDPMNLILTGGTTGTPSTDVTYGRKYVFTPSGNNCGAMFELKLRGAIARYDRVTMVSLIKLPTFTSGAFQLELWEDDVSQSLLLLIGTAGSAQILKLLFPVCPTSAITTKIQFYLYAVGAGGVAGTAELYSFALYGGEGAPRIEYPSYPNNIITYNSAAPTAGTWVRGDWTINNAPAAAGVPGWVCTTAGTPGTWKAMAAVAA